MGAIFFIIFIFLAVFYGLRNHKLASDTKLVIKAIISALSIIITIGLFKFSISLCMDAYDDEKWMSLASRVQRVNQAVESGNFYQLNDRLNLYDSYEEDFEYAWERLHMYQIYRFCQIYESAKEIELGEDYSRLAEQYRQELVSVCTEPEYAENQMYGQYLLGKLDLDK